MSTSLAKRPSFDLALIPSSSALTDTSGSGERLSAPLLPIIGTDIFAKVDGFDLLSVPENGRFVIDGKEITVQQARDMGDLFEVAMTDIQRVSGGFAELVMSNIIGVMFGGFSLNDEPKTPGLIVRTRKNGLAAEGSQISTVSVSSSTQPAKDVGVNTLLPIAIKLKGGKVIYMSVVFGAPAVARKHAAVLAQVLQVAAMASKSETLTWSIDVTEVKSGDGITHQAINAISFKGDGGSESKWVRPAQK